MDGAHRFARIDRSLLLLKFVTAVILAGVVTLLGRAFFG